MSAREAALLEVRELSFGYGEKAVLEDCSLTVPRNERLVLMGVSGGGKSTLLRLILGLIWPRAGTIRFDGQELTQLSARQIDEVRPRIGMVYQSAALISSLSVEENLKLPLLELSARNGREIDEIVEEKLELVGLPESKAQLPSELSGGMRKRVSLARALVLEPELILFDEPSSGLDPVATSLIDELIVGISEKLGTTCVITTHNMSSAFRVATRMALLHEGAVLVEGPPEEFRDAQDPIVRQFVAGEPRGPLTPEA
jgi:phospholipid/cholesterol/gamma-HCH transport system ATP-binding protein